MTTCDTPQECSDMRRVILVGIRDANFRHVYNDKQSVDLALCLLCEACCRRFMNNEKKMNAVNLDAPDEEEAPMPAADEENDQKE